MREERLCATVVVVLMSLVGCATSTQDRIADLEGKKDVASLARIAKNRKLAAGIRTKAVTSLGNVANAQAVQTLIGLLADDTAVGQPLWRVIIPEGKTVKDPRSSVPLYLTGTREQTTVMGMAITNSTLVDSRDVANAFAAQGAEVQDIGTVTYPIKTAAQNALKHVTGHDYGLSQFQWQSWWNQSKGTWQETRLFSGLAPDTLSDGYNYYLQGDYDRAIAEYSKAIAKKPSAVLYSQRANALVHKGEYESAIADATRAIQLNPNAAEAYTARGYAYLKTLSLDRAISDFDKGVSLPTRSRDTYLGRARAYAYMGDFDRALADLAKAHKPELGILRTLRPPISMRHPEKEVEESLKNSPWDDLKVALESGDSPTRKAVADILGQRKEARAMEPLVAALEDKDEHVRANAAWALGELRASRAVLPLTKTLDDEAVQLNSAYALGSVGDEQARTSLLAKLMDISIDDTLFLENVVWALKMIKEKN